MPRRKRVPKRRIIRLYTNKMPEIMPWLDAQENQSMSVYMLIRMAQKLYGNSNWPDVMQSLADSSILDKFTTHESSHLNNKTTAKDADKSNMSTSFIPNRSTKSTHLGTTHNNMGNKQHTNGDTPSSHNLNITNKKDKKSSNRRMNSSDLKDLLG